MVFSVRLSAFYGVTPSVFYGVRRKHLLWGALQVFSFHKDKKQENRPAKNNKIVNDEIIFVRKLKNRQWLWEFCDKQENRPAAYLAYARSDLSQSGAKFTNQNDFTKTKK